jgi:MFS superfamily sulfate permease-like transporter
LRYDRSWLPADLAAGLSVAAVALPVGIAYSDLVGVPAVVGIYAAIFPLFAYALFGSSRQLITGPDSATCVLVAASLGPLAGGDPQRYAALVVILTLVTGAWLLVAGVLRLGFLASFLSQPILTGFLNAIALIIIAGQLKTLFGYAGSADDFFPTVIELATSIPETNAATLAFGLVLLTALLALRRWLPRAPAALLLVVLGIVAVEALRLDERGITVLGIVPAG